MNQGPQRPGKSRIWDRIRPVMALKDPYRNFEVPPDLIQEVLEKKGRYVLTTYGGSMVPFIQHGETIRVESCPMERLEWGDVVFFCEGTRFFAHRLLRRHFSESGDLSLGCKGDTLSLRDEPATPDQYLGLITAVSRGGRWVDLRTRGFRILGKVLAVFSFGAYLAAFPLRRICRLTMGRYTGHGLALIRLAVCGPTYLCCRLGLKLVRERPASG